MLCFTFWITKRDVGHCMCCRLHRSSELSCAVWLGISLSFACQEYFKTFLCYIGKYLIAAGFSRSREVSSFGERGQDAKGTPATVPFSSALYSRPRSFPAMSRPFCPFVPFQPATPPACPFPSTPARPAAISIASLNIRFSPTTVCSAAQLGRRFLQDSIHQLVSRPYVVMPPYRASAAPDLQTVRSLPA